MQFICVQSVHVCSGKKLSSDLYGNILAQGPTFYLTPILHVISFHGRGSYSCMFFSKLYNNLLDFLQKKCPFVLGLTQVFLSHKDGVWKISPSSHSLAFFRSTFGFRCTTLPARQKKKSPFEGDYTPSNFVAQFLLVLSLCGIVIYIILVVVVVVMVFLG